MYYKRFVLLVIFCSVLGSAAGSDQLLPQQAGLWRLTGEIEKYQGDDLFLFINGGAEIYYEYGFKWVIAGVYKTANGQSINTEVYHMKDSAAAFGVYTFKTGLAGEKVELGHDCLLEDYYLNFWQGDYLITLTGFNSEKQTIAGLKAIARAIAAGLKQKGELPALTKLLASKGLKKINYLRGNLGLFNSYEFSSADVFRLKEGVYGEYQDRRVFIFQYQDKNTARQVLTAAITQFKKETRFSGFKKEGSSYLMIDRKGNMLKLTTDKNKIIIHISQTD